MTKNFLLASGGGWGENSVLSVNSVAKKKNSLRTWLRGWSKVSIAKKFLIAQRGGWSKASVVSSLKAKLSQFIF